MLLDIYFRLYYKLKLIFVSYFEKYYYEADEYHISIEILVKDHF